MTDQVTFVETPQIQVVFPQRFNVERYASTEQLINVVDVLEEGDDLSAVSDGTLKERVAMHFDFPVEEMSNMQVSRPQENMVLISAKFQYG